MMPSGRAKTTVNVLVTGGAGFIGTHVAARLLEAGHSVRIVDRGPRGALDAVHVQGDIGSPAVAAAALHGMDAVIHLAARDGASSSIVEPDAFVQDNSHATAVFLRACVDAGIGRIVTASSRCVYGEGLYKNTHGGLVEPTRERQGLERGEWDTFGDDGPLVPVATPEWKRPEPGSVHALTKFDQERLTVMLGEAYGLSVVALRLFDVYGPGQPTGPAAADMGRWAAQIMEGAAPRVAEDGQQLRDFVHVDDAARAFCMAVGADIEGVLNIGTGRPVPTLQAATWLAAEMDAPEPQITGRSQPGEPRHCFADVEKARTMLAYETQVGLRQAIRGMAGWLPESTPRTPRSSVRTH